MAEYFAQAGWNDITLAVPVNLRQAAGLNRLAGQVRLGLLVESMEAVRGLGQALSAPVDLWIKVDAGAHRTGILWSETGTAAQLAESISAYPQLRLVGLLTHAGHSYTAPDSAGALAIFNESTARLDELRQALQTRGIHPLRVSVGDTPGCSAARDFGPADEVRPGNFVFYDAEQYLFGACQWSDIAVALACPVVALHPERGEAVVYGGAVHLSKDFYEQPGRRLYGLVSLPEGERWSAPLADAWVDRVSQEHGILRLSPAHLAELHVGDLVCILPAHSCLTAQCMGRYLSLDGRWIEMMR
jgi:D-serine deaminase-like pyridoxal phosphate-dependent protein